MAKRIGDPNEPWTDTKAKNYIWSGFRKKYPFLKEIMGNVDTHKQPHTSNVICDVHHTKVSNFLGHASF
jgi:hypothetical protein